jgi:hypothetical protein
VLYVRDNAVWHGEAAKEIPVGIAAFVADDAHRLAFLDELLTLVSALRQRQGIDVRKKSAGVSHRPRRCWVDGGGTVANRRNVLRFEVGPFAVRS